LDRRGLEFSGFIPINLYFFGAPTPPASPERDRCNGGGGRDLEVSLDGFFQDQLIQRQTRHRLAQALVLAFQFLQKARLVDLHVAVFLMPAIVTLFENAYPAADRPDFLYLCQGNLGFAQKTENLFRAIAFATHSFLLQ